MYTYEGVKFNKKEKPKRDLESDAQALVKLLEEQLSVEKEEKSTVLFCFLNVLIITE